MADRLLRIHGASARPENNLDVFEHPVETGELAFQSLHARFGELVDAHAAVGRRRNSPLGPDKLLFQQPLQRRIKRTLFLLKEVVGTLLDVLDQRVSVRRLAAERLENHHFERAWKQIARGVFAVFHKAKYNYA